MGKLRAYSVGEEDFDQTLVFARTAKDAKKIGSSYVEYDCWIDLRAERREHLDKHVRPEAVKPYSEQDMEVLRRAGWRYEEEDSCASCGLSPMGMGEYAICECCQCPECGCECEEDEASEVTG